MQEYLGKGYEPKKAAVDSAKQYFMPMMLATLCISVIFFPLLLTFKGGFKDAMEDFPMTIAINLMVSLLLAVMVIPFLEILIINCIYGHLFLVAKVRNFCERICSIWN